MAKPVFATAIICTLIGVILIAAGIFLYSIPKYYDISVTVLTAATVISLLAAPLLWLAYYVMTHFSADEALEYLNAPPETEYFPAPKSPKQRFNFKEEDVRAAFGKIAEKYKMSHYIDVQNYEILPFGYDCLTKKRYNIRFVSGHVIFCTVSIFQEGITFSAYNMSEPAKFLFLDDFSRTNNLGIGNGNIFVSEIFFDALSDEEIFGIIEKMIYVLYGVSEMSAEKTEKSLYRKYYTAYDYVFYLDAPDYYGYTETTEIGNFKFILNGGKQNV